MSFLGDKERHSIIEALIGLGGQLFQSYSSDTAKLVDSACSYAVHMVKTGQWSEKMGQLHIKIATSSAAAYYANKTSVLYNHVRSTIWSILDILRGVINARAGFKLIPDFG